MYNSPKAVLKGVKAEFFKQLGDYGNFNFSPFTQMTTSNSDQEDYLFTDAFPAIKEWVDEIDGSFMKDYVLTIRNKPWEYSMRVDRFTLDDSRQSLGGNIEMNIRASVTQWQGFKDQLINQLISDNGTAFDGSTFFGNSHNIDGDNAIDNLNSGNGTTLSQITTDLAAARNSMFGFRDRNNRPINTNPRFAVLIPSQLLDTFLTLQNSQTVTTGTSKTNIYQNSFEIIVNNWQSTSDNDWYLINTNATIPAFILQNRENPMWNVKDEADKRYIKYFSTSRMNAGYGSFTSILKVDNS